MRFRALLILALVVGVIGLLYVAGRKSNRSSEVPGASIANPPTATKSVFRKAANSFATFESTEPAPANTTSNFLQQLIAGELDLQLSSEQLAEYLRQHGTNVETLLATQRTNYIRLAAELFPNDPRVQYAVLARELFPEARREWLDRFKQSAPDNSVADYLSARDYLKAGDRENALKDLANAAGKSRFDDYSLGQLQDMEDAQLSAGRTLLEAKAAGAELLMPQMAMFKNLAQEIQTMQKEYIGAGDTASAETLAQLGHSLAQQLHQGDGSRTILGQLVGIAIERIVLNQLPPDSQPSFLNGTVQQRLDEMNGYRQNIRSLTADFGPTIGRASEAEVISYFDRMKLQGESKAMLWLQNRNKLR